MSKTTSHRRKPRKLTPVFVIVPKHQMRAKKPAMLADPRKVVVTQLTEELGKARTFGSRSGAFRAVTEHKELAKKFWYKRVA
jgi:hypothetical protein